MPKYKVTLEWEVIIKNADDKEEALTHAIEQLYDDMTQNANELMWKVKKLRE